MIPPFIRRLFILSLMLGAAWAGAEPAGMEFPPGGRNLLSSDRLAGASVLVPEGSKEVTSAIQRVEDVPWAEYWRVEIKKRPPNSWSVQVASEVKGAIEKGDTCLLVFFARAVIGKASGAASVEVRAAPAYPKLGTTQFRVGTQWQPVILPFVAGEEGPDGQCAVSIHLGGDVQTVDIGGLRLLNYGPGFPVQKLPQPRYTYEGREPDAPWRAEALKRIESHRKGDFSVSLVHQDGRPATHLPVEIVLKRHAFGFGSAVTAQWMADPSADGERYRAIVDECFSRVVFENDMKPDPWLSGIDPRATGGFRKDWLDQSLNWLAGRHFSVRGHYLCWGPFEEWSTQLKDRPQAIREKVFAHLRDIAPAMEEHVTEWDALNHPAGWEPGSTVDTVLGDDFYGEVFREARKLTRHPLWINEDQVFRPGRQQEEYFEIIEKLIASGVTPDGIGNQGHFESSFLPSPVEMLANSDRFAKLVPALQITEFDVATQGDETLAADFTRDLLITTFSHPAYTGFVLWGFWEGAHWKPETALWRKDWSEKPAAKVWRDLVCQQWHTRERSKSDESGRLDFRGFFGTYDIHVDTPEGRRTLTVDFGPSETRSMTIPIPPVP